MFPNKSLAPFSLSLLFFLLLSSAYAFNITKILSQYPDFSTFNNDLTQTHLADQINSRQTITVLAVDNGAMSAVSGQSPDMIKNALSVHIVLDYYDVQKLQKLQNKSTILTTLFQAGGQAKGQQGFLNVTNLDTGGVAFGSAVPGSKLGSNLVKSVASEPYNISVLQVSNVILPSATGSSSNSSSNSTTSKPPAATPSKSPTPATSPTKSPPTTPPSKAPAPSNAKTPAASPPTPKSGNAPSPSNAPPTTSPSPVATPPATATTPAGSTPVADGPAAAAPPKSTSGPPKGANLGVLIMVISYATCSLAYMI